MIFYESDITLHILSESEKGRHILASPHEIKLTHDKETFESMGFSFVDIEREAGTVHRVFLPEGWKFESTIRDDLCYHIIDEKGRSRILVTRIIDETLMLSMQKRYNILYMDNQNEVNFFAVDSDGNELYYAGSCNRSNSDAFKSLTENVKNYLNENFPGWEDITSYWDN